MVGSFAGGDSEPATSRCYLGRCMDRAGRRRELARILTDRRRRLQPDDVGLPQGGRRRVAGLRRNEVAALAGLGVSWYAMLENGTAGKVSYETLAYLHRLAEQRQGSAPRHEIGELTRDALAAIEWAPAYVLPDASSAARLREVL